MTLAPMESLIESMIFRDLPLMILQVPSSLVLTKSLFANGT